MFKRLKRWWNEPRSYTEKHWRVITGCRNCNMLSEDPREYCKRCGSVDLFTREGKYRVKERTRLDCTWYIVWRDTGEELEFEFI